MKRKVKTMSIEDAIKEKFPDATIYEVRNDRFGKCILGVVPTKDGKDHIVEWDKSGNASECEVGGRDFREIRWNEEDQRPEYIHTKLLLHDDRFNVQVDASK